MRLFKGEEIVHKKIRMPSHIPKAVKILETLASNNEDILEFIDLNENDIEKKKSFYPMINRCELMEIKLNALEKFAHEFNIKIDNYKNYYSFKEALIKDQRNRDINNNSYFDYIESEILEEDKTINELYESYNQIKENLMLEIQRKITLEKYFSLTAATIIDINNINKNRRKISDSNNKNEDLNDNIINNKNIIREDSLSNVSIDSIIRENQYEPILGLCYASDELRMKRMIFRTSRDKVLCTFFDAEFQDEFKPKEQMKIFVIFCPKIDYLITKLLKVCDIYNCPRFDIPNDYAGHVMEILPNIEDKIMEHKNYLFEAKRTLKSHLEEYITIQKKLQLYKIYFRKEKMIFINLSKCICGENFIDGEVWMLKNSFDKISQQINLGNEDDDSKPAFIDLKDYGMERPTYIKTNSFTYPFQEIVNQYGIPNYHEINPGFFTIITFPFLFGIMFGDIGHGIILLCITIYLFYLANKSRRAGIINNDSLEQDDEENILDSKEDSILKSLVLFRYFFLMCSIFAIFCGFMYNEFFSIPLNLFGTCYTGGKNGHFIQNKINLDNKKVEKCVYPFGLDPIWIGNQNELVFTNSLKMKLSIIVGVLHMLLGIGIKGINKLNEKKYTHFFFEFIPQFLFMLTIFGYLIYMIFYKWSIDYDNNTENAPSLLSIMINMAVKFGKVEGEPLFDSFLTLSQESLHKFLLIFCVILIPIMLLINPIYFYFKKQQSKGIKIREDIGLIDNENKNEDDLILENNNNENNDLNNSGEYSLSLSQESVIKQNEHYSKLYLEQKKKYKEEAKEKFKFVEIFIGQLIEVIEYVLGTVSNTASYLRLWALSLAHTALSHVFINKTFLVYIQNDDINFVSSVVNVFLFFNVFLGATSFILIFMDAMECILHTLRLHWVEFQNKFYKGGGYMFNPFSFKNIFTENDSSNE